MHDSSASLPKSIGLAVDLWNSNLGIQIDTNLDRYSSFAQQHDGWMEHLNSWSILSPDSFTSGSGGSLFAPFISHFPSLYSSRLLQTLKNGRLSPRSTQGIAQAQNRPAGQYFTGDSLESEGVIAEYDSAPALSQPNLLNLIASAAALTEKPSVIPSTSMPSSVRGRKESSGFPSVLFDLHGIASTPRETGMAKSEHLALQDENVIAGELPLAIQDHPTILSATSLEMPDAAGQNFLRALSRSTSSEPVPSKLSAQSSGPAHSSIRLAATQSHINPSLGVVGLDDQQVSAKDSLTPLMGIVANRDGIAQPQRPSRYGVDPQNQVNTVDSVSSDLKGIHSDTIPQGMSNQGSLLLAPISENLNLPALPDRPGTGIINDEAQLFDRLGIGAELSLGPTPSLIDTGVRAVITPSPEAAGVPVPDVLSYRLAKDHGDTTLSPSIDLSRASETLASSSVMPVLTDTTVKGQEVHSIENSMTVAESHRDPSRLWTNQHQISGEQTEIPHSSVDATISSSHDSIGQSFQSLSQTNGVVSDLNWMTRGIGLATKAEGNENAAPPLDAFDIVPPPVLAGRHSGVLILDEEGATPLGILPSAVHQQIDHNETGNELRESQSVPPRSSVDGNVLVQGNRKLEATSSFGVPSALSQASIHPGAATEREYLASIQPDATTENQYLASAGTNSASPSETRVRSSIVNGSTESRDRESSATGLYESVLPHTYYFFGEVPSADQSQVLPFDGIGGTQLAGDWLDPSAKYLPISRTLLNPRSELSRPSNLSMLLPMNELGNNPVQPVHSALRPNVLSGVPKDPASETHVSPRSMRTSELLPFNDRADTQGGMLHVQPTRKSLINVVASELSGKEVPSELWNSIRPILARILESDRRNSSHSPSELSRLGLTSTDRDVNRRTAVTHDEIADDILSRSTALNSIFGSPSDEGSREWTDSQVAGSLQQSTGLHGALFSEFSRDTGVTPGEPSIRASSRSSWMDTNLEQLLGTAIASFQAKMFESERDGIASSEEASGTRAFSSHYPEQGNTVHQELVAPNDSGVVETPHAVAGQMTSGDRLLLARVIQRTLNHAQLDVDSLESTNALASLMDSYSEFLTNKNLESNPLEPNFFEGILPFNIPSFLSLRSGELENSESSSDLIDLLLPSGAIVPSLDSLLIPQLAIYPTLRQDQASLNGASESSLSAANQMIAGPPGQSAQYSGLRIGKAVESGIGYSGTTSTPDLASRSDYDENSFGPSRESYSPSYMPGQMPGGPGPSFAYSGGGERGIAVRPSEYNSVRSNQSSNALPPDRTVLPAIATSERMHVGHEGVGFIDNINSFQQFYPEMIGSKNMQVSLNVDDLDSSSELHSIQEKFTTFSSRGLSVARMGSLLSDYSGDQAQIGLRSKSGSPSLASMLGVEHSSESASKFVIEGLLSETQGSDLRNRDFAGVDQNEGPWDYPLDLDDATFGIGEHFNSSNPSLHGQRGDRRTTVAPSAYSSEYVNDSLGEMDARTQRSRVADLLRLSSLKRSGIVPSDDMSSREVSKAQGGSEAGPLAHGALNQPLLTREPVSRDSVDMAPGVYAAGPDSSANTSHASRRWEELEKIEKEKYFSREVSAENRAFEMALMEIRWRMKFTDRWDLERE